MVTSLPLYLALKLLHLIGAAVLFGTGLGIAFFLFRAERKEEPATIAATLRTVVLADHVFTATAAIAQPVTGFASSISVATISARRGSGQALRSMC